MLTDGAAPDCIAGKYFILSVGFSRLACVNPTLDFTARAQRSGTVRPPLVGELSLCDYRPLLVQALFFVAWPARD